MCAEINQFSRRFLTFLERADPHLARMVYANRDQEGRAASSISSKIPAPGATTTPPLWVTTDDDEVTVSFDAFHAHFGGAETEDEAFAKAVALIHDIMAARLSVASWWKDEKCQGSRLVEAGADAKRPEFVDPAAALKVQSWKS